MIFIGLLTHEQKQAGYFVSQDEDFVYLFHRDDGDPRLITIFDYLHCRIGDVRDAAEWDLKYTKEFKDEVTTK